MDTDMSSPAFQQTSPGKYAGIGSRRTPMHICQIMKFFGMKLADTGWLLRSGGAEGADSAFEEGCDVSEGQKEIFLPWPKFNGNTSTLAMGDRETDKWAYDLAMEKFPWFKEMKPNIRPLIARNMMQVLGVFGNDPVDLVICWTDSDKGGTTYALTIARERGIPIWNLHNDPNLEEARDYIAKI